jgi:uncharacterized membrane protein YkgB
MHAKNKNHGPNIVSLLGYYISLGGAVLILLWIGIFKFTPTEANAIKPLIENHPLSSWMYNILSVQSVSNIVGVVEILAAILLILTLKFDKLKKYAGFAMCIIFLMTLSYLFTTPNMWKIIDGVPYTDFFILKDLMYLGFGMHLVSYKAV